MFDLLDRTAPKWWKQWDLYRLKVKVGCPIGFIFGTIRPCSIALVAWPSVYCFSPLGLSIHRTPERSTESYHTLV